MIILLLLEILAYVFICIGWGFWPAVIIFAIDVFITWLGKPKYTFDVNWAAFASSFIAIVLAIFAINDKWHNPTANIAAIAVTIILAAMAIK